MSLATMNAYEVHLMSNQAEKSLLRLLTSKTLVISRASELFSPCPFAKND